jgi:hypothetical protein
VSANVVITKRLYDLWLAEANRIHDLCDLAQIPRGAEGLELSLSQRVEVLAGVLQGLVAKVGQQGPVH